MNNYLLNLYKSLEKKYPLEKEYLQAIKSFFISIDDAVTKNPEIEKLNIIERIIYPDRIITFKVPWINDQGEVKVNMGYRVQFSNLLGPYKGGTRFDPRLDLSTLKFLAFEQTFKNSLTNLPLGGAKGGSDFDPRGKSDFEIMQFSKNYMLEAYKYFGNDIDVPAGDFGVSKKEIGYMFGTYKKLTNKHHAYFTGKDVSVGGLLGRYEATGYGIGYISNKALDIYFNTSYLNKDVVISGSGAVGINTAYKVKSLGAKVVAMSNISGVIYDQNGIDIDLINELNLKNISLKNYLEKYPNATFNPDLKSIWKIKAHIIIPCATQNEIDEIDAKNFIKNNVMMVAEGANMPLTLEAQQLLILNKILLLPSKAANAGGVSASAIEVMQNATHQTFTFAEVDLKIKNIMESIFDNIYQTSVELNNPYNLVKAANLYSFNKIYEAMKNQGV